MKRLTALLLTAVLCLSFVLPTAAAEAPDDWAQTAVDFCTENGLLSADDLRPREAASRAELASMVVRLLAVEDRADLSGISDVNPAAWYYDELAGAVAIGVYEGSDGALRPLEELTRQEAMTVLARAFAVPDGDVAALQAAYSDAWQLEPWAVGPVAGLTEAGAVRGSGGTLRPQAQISRQELAQLLLSLAGTVAERTAELPDEGSVVWTGGDLSNRTVAGNLYLAGSQERTLRNVRVDGRIVVYSGAVTLAGSSAAAEVVVCGDAAVETDGDVPVRAASGRAEISGGGTVTAEADAVLTGGRYELVRVAGAAVTVESGATVASAELAGQGSTISGGGRVTEAVLRTDGCTVETEGTDVVEALRPGLSQARLVLTVTREATPTAPTMELSVQLENGDAAASGTGILTWYGGGELAGRNLAFPLTDGAVTTITVPADYTGSVSPERTVLVELSDGSTAISATASLSQHIEQLQTGVRTLEVEATVRRDTALYQYMDLSGWIRTVPAGTTAVYINYSGTYAAKLRLADGTTGWVRWSDVSISSEDYVQYTDYDTATKENFVNSIGYESTTSYLVWISLLTQKVNVFTGSAQHWELQHTFPCTTGKNTTPTIGGVFRYQYRQNYWDFGYYYVNKPMIFNGGHAFHTRTYIKGTTSLLDPTMGSTASQGCVRMLDADVDWLWDNMPFGTTVVVF